MPIFFRYRMLLLTTVLTLTACGGSPWWLPRAHKITIQQGNLLSLQQISSVTVGMLQDDVRAVLGAPITNTLFHDNRWDYLYTRGPAGAAIEARRLSIFFTAGHVSNIDKSPVAVSGELPQQYNWWERLFPPADAS